MTIDPGSRTGISCLWRVAFGVAAWVCLFGLGGCVPSADKATSGDSSAVRGIVLITVDGLIAENLSIWGGPVVSEGLEQLAAEGRAWRDVWTPSPMTRPAATSLLTGRSPDRHGVVDDVFGSLPEGKPTLATQLGSRGFRTAAFPDSSFVGPPSGLLRDFEVWDAPPSPFLGGRRWIPAVKATSSQLEAFRAWMASLGPDERFFGWVHVARPVLAQLADGADGPPPAILEHFVAVIDGVVEAASGPRVAVAVIGTFADVGGGDDGLAGIGYSLEERAVRVPLIARFPGPRSGVRPADAPVWGLDLTATLARLGGVSLPGCEGIDLSGPRDATDPMFTFGWATLDQMGWKAQRAVRLGSAKRIEGLETVTLNLGDRAGKVDPERDFLLAEALSGRDQPPRTLVPLEAVGDLLRANGLTPNPQPVTGRDFASHRERVQVARAMWKSRQSAFRNDSEGEIAELAKVADLDPDNLGALLDRGQMILQSEPQLAAPLLRRGVELYPGNPETLHWWAHSLWAENWRAGEKILKATIPFVPHDRDMLYDLACSSSLGEDLDASEGYLRSAIEAGYEHWEYMQVDPDLRNLRESGRFARLMQEYRQ